MGRVPLSESPRTQPQAGQTRVDFGRWWPLSVSPNRDHGRLANSKQICSGNWHAHTNRISRGQMHPVQASLHVRKASFQTANHVGIWCDSETDAIHYAREVHVWSRHYINIGLHAWHDSLQLAFTKVTNGPPGARVNESKHLLADVGISAFRNREIGHTGIERCVHAAVFQIVAGVFHSCCLCSTLVDEWL